jgi:hypothetical protein
MNRVAALERAIASAYTQTYKDLEVVVVDNASEDATRQMVTERFKCARYIRLPRNLGCPEGRNHVFANASGEFIVCVDDDGYLEHDAVEKVVRAFETDERIGVVAMRQRFTDEGSSRAQSDVPLADVGVFSGGVSALRKAMLDEIGGYPSDFFLFGEESFLALKALDRGFRIVSEPLAIMWHPRIGSSASNRLDFFRFRNPLLTAVRLFPTAWVPIYLMGRMARYFVVALKRRSLLQYLRAAAAVLGSLPWELASREPVRAESVRRHFRLIAPR